MRRSVLLSLAAAGALFLASCTGGAAEKRNLRSPTPEYWRGGTLRIAAMYLGQGRWDPQRTYGIDSGIFDPVASDLPRVFAADRESEGYKLAADMLLGRDPFGGEYVAAFRDGRLGRD